MHFLIDQFCCIPKKLGDSDVYRSVVRDILNIQIVITSILSSELVTRINIIENFLKFYKSKCNFDIK